MTGRVTMLNISRWTSNATTTANVVSNTIETVFGDEHTQKVSGHFGVPVVADITPSVGFCLETRCGTA